MTDSTWIRAYNNKSIYTGGQVQAGTILSNGRMTANEFVQLNGVATAGAACSPNGLIGRDAAGGILSCQSGVWKASDSGVYVEMGSYETKSTRGVTYQIPGTHKFCLVSGLMSAGDNGTCKIRPSGNDWFLDMVGYNGSSTQTCWVSCLD